MILDIYNQATPSEIESGMNWYQEAHEWATKLAKENEVSTEVVAAVTAALSPANKWERNKADAERFITTYAAGLPLDELTANTYNRNKEVAKRALELGIEALGGNKTINFAWNILEPCGGHEVVIDRHAWNITQGERIIKNKTGIKVTPKRYRVAAEKYRSLAEKLGIRPNQLQAITWLTWRRLIDVHNPRANAY